MHTEKLHYMNALGIDVWELRTAKTSTSTLSTTNEWDTLRADIAACTACGLDKTRTQTVFGVGNRNADLMIIGEAPGFYEDKAGEPFVGRGGFGGS